MGIESGARSNWYVVQVRSTAEAGMCRQIVRLCAEHDRNADDASCCVGLRECFSPSFKTQRKWKGEWQDAQHLLLPGYVIADAENPLQLAEVLHGIRDLCRLLSSGETYEPLNAAERSWIERQTHKGDRVIPMSFARKVGDEIEVTDGPLKGYAGTIERIDRANSLAYLELHVGQMTIRTKVGLAVIPG